jgi:GH18 family chitinase
MIIIVTSRMLRLLLSFLFLSNTFAFRLSSWFLPNNVEHIEKFPWDSYTHLRYGYPIVYSNGTTACNTSDNFHRTFVEKAHKHNIKVLWGPGSFNFSNFLWQSSREKENYFNTIGNSVKQCNIDGIEIDYEWQDITDKTQGIIPPHLSTIYTKFLERLKKTLGINKIVSADVSIWGIAPGNYLLGILPWINPTMLNAGAFDFINTMSYHWAAGGEIWPWIKDAFFIDLWGIDRKRVNIGIPFFSKQWKDFKLISEPTWNTLSKFCPNIHPSKNICNNVTFIGKKMNQQIGNFLRREKFGGAFPWAATYDSFVYNNTLITWLAGIK